MNTRWSPSVTVAAIVHDGGPDADLNDPARRFLLVEEHTPEGLRLNNPAGHLDPGETPLQAVVRETLEETARVFTPQALVGVYLARFTREARAGHAAEDVTYLRFSYCGTVGDADPTRALDTPIVRTLWLTREEMAQQAARLRSPLVLRSIDDHRAGCRWPADLVQGDASLLAPRVLG
jgi:8-oxo-dGTP pyrophosphatase MutT (NUDIX family)